ncbi:Uncharacterized 2Fe-2 and 4Fe-4S clusters-containing protein, contains DUF4445 domain [Peptostreptococcus russellii]|uniref:Uncharacterized 2Fe-2 and 4Fe-4S clusters-containing protein, contains DUF4445 domain n=1 Tax=Peptostreptococcus russellii TaxID=215200 RepID=A0A1H8JV67_9FIRM|nr:ASKHA domain-containing protein [Peptostreptococcus russellii]SEN84622.1 Uncharacterized 2Fe-2 and 4Fe-4S clusters-containing protein, contains DUF4445 domain [Peptostreptococcus russellii]
MKLKVGNKQYSFEKGENLLEIMLRNKIDIENNCNGKGSCGKCRVRILSDYKGEATKLEKEILTAEEIDSGVRLACKTKVEENIEIGGIKKSFLDRNILTSGFIPDFKKDNSYKAYGLAIDIGTTTMALSLLNMENHEEISQASSINPQKKYGMDVLTRITYAVENKDGVKELQRILVKGINGMIEEACSKAEKNSSLERDFIKNKIREIVVSANCTMTHTLLGEDIRPLGKYPYKPVFKERKVLKAKEIGIDVLEECSLYTFPQISAFIGGDIVAGAYVCELDKVEKNTLFIDIGTNGELILADTESLMSCSCAAGPALEGMNIKYGMRAQEGAIEDIIIEKDASLKLKVIGDKEAEGLCGSGILAAIRELLKNKLIKSRGALLKLDEIDDSNKLKKLIRQVDGKREFLISENLQVTQSDVRQVQLAKGAILSGIMALLENANLKVEDIEEVIIAGQFGKHISEESLIVTGILPKQVRGKIKYMGNTSKTGAYMFLTSYEARKNIENLAKKIEYYELSTMKDYEKIFTKSLMFK